MTALSFSFPADLFGILGIISTVLLYQQRTAVRQLWYKLTTDLLWIVYYVLMKNYSVVAITLVAVLRSIILLNHKRQWARGAWWLCLFMAASIAFSLIAWKDWTSSLTMASSLICIGMYWFRSAKMVRWLTIPGSILFLINVLLNGNLMGTISESFLLLSTVIGIIRLDLIPYIKNRGEKPCRRMPGKP